MAATVEEVCFEDKSFFYFVKTSQSIPSQYFYDTQLGESIQ